MAVIGRTGVFQSNLVRDLPVLPYPMTYGRVSWDLTWNAQEISTDNSANFVYEGVVSRAEVDAIYAAYPEWSVVTLYGLEFEVERRSYNRLAVYDPQGDIEQYTVTIALRKKSLTAAEQEALLRNPPRPRWLSPPSFNRWDFLDVQVIADGENAIAVDSEIYNNAQLTWSGSETSTVSGTGPRTVFSLREPVREEFVEQSRDLRLPPENTRVLRDLSSNYDKSGPKKVYKKSVKIDSTDEYDELEEWGFDYTLSDISVGGNYYFSDSPEDFWKRISYRQTRYIYQRNGATTLQVRIQAPTRLSSSGQLRFVVHPDYQQFADVSVIGGVITVRSNALFLVESVSTGWNLHRFLDETETGESSLDGPNSPKYDLFFSQQVPFYSRNVFLLAPARRIYGDSVPPPFRIEFADYNSLEPRIRNLFASSNANNFTEDGRVAILYPDPNFVEPLVTIADESASNSFAWRPNPDASVDPDRFIPGTSVVAPPPRYMTGQESRNEVWRTIIGQNRYSERVLEFSAQDPQFGNSAEMISFRQMSGQPPGPSYRIREWQETNQDANRISSSVSVSHYVTTEDGDRVAQGGIQLPTGDRYYETVSISGARNFEEAKIGLDWQIRCASMQSSQAQRVISWFYPQIRGGDFVTTGGDRFADRGQWRVMSASWQLEYKGISETFGAIVTTPGTTLTLGLDKSKGLTYTQSADSSGNGLNGGDPVVDVDLIGDPGNLGNVLPPLQNRRWN